MQLQGGTLFTFRPVFCMF